LVANNQIVDTEFKAIGIISNFTSPGCDLDTIKTLSSIRNNLIQGTKEGIQVFGNFVTKLIVDSNTIRNPQKRGIDIDSDAADYQVSLIANRLIFDNQVEQRIGILSYTRKKALSGQRLIINHNRFVYNQSPLNGLQTETGLLIGTNNVVLTDNIIISKNKNLNLLSFTHNAVTGLRASGNILNGKNFSFLNL
jgi:hypothetical protein